jgi:LysM repeat protein
MPNWTQISGVLDRVLLVGLTWLASKGYITTADVANYAALILGIAGAGYAFWINRQTNLVNRASSVPGTTVVTTPAIAAALPQTNVVSNEDKKVVTK